MGHHSASCFISGLPISGGDRAILIPLMQGGKGRHGVWFPIKGVYDDYGSLEDIEDVYENRVLLDYVNERLQQPLGELTDEVRDALVEIKKIQAELQDDNGSEKKLRARVDEMFKYHAVVDRVSAAHTFPMTLGKDANNRHSDIQGNQFASMKQFVDALTRSQYDDLLSVQLPPAVYGDADYQMCRFGFLMVHGTVWDALEDYIMNKDVDSVYVHEGLPADLKDKYPLGKYQNIEGNGEFRFGYLMDRYARPDVSHFTLDIVEACGGDADLIASLFGKSKTTDPVDKDKIKELHANGLRNKLTVANLIEHLYLDRDDHRLYSHSMMSDLLRILTNMDGSVTEETRRVARNHYILTHMLFFTRKTLDVRTGYGTQDAYESRGAMCALAKAILKECQDNEEGEDKGDG